MWVIGHKRIKRNEHADILAKDEASTPFPCSESFCEFSKSHMKHISLSEQRAKTKASITVD